MNRGTKQLMDSNWQDTNKALLFYCLEIVQDDRFCMLFVGFRRLEEAAGAAVGAGMAAESRR